MNLMNVCIIFTFLNSICFDFYIQFSVFSIIEIIALNIYFCIAKCLVLMSYNVLSLLTRIVFINHVTSIRVEFTTTFTYTDNGCTF